MSLTNFYLNHNKEACKDIEIYDAKTPSTNDETREKYSSNNPCTVIERQHLSPLARFYYRNTGNRSNTPKQKQRRISRTTLTENDIDPEEYDAETDEPTQEDIAEYNGVWTE
jgi:hypothetical protein